jgi:hypothetical protein
MNPAELEALLSGLLRLWQVEARLAVAREGDGLRADITKVGALVTVEQSIQPFGIAWHVQAEGKRRLAYPSTIGMIKHLREVLAPERGVARVMFAAAGA